MPSDTQVIYSMMRLGRIHPPIKQVLRDILLGFYYGARIGALGLNGSGKSTALCVMYKRLCLPRPARLQRPVWRNNNPGKCLCLLH